MTIVSEDGRIPDTDIRDAIRAGVFTGPTSGWRAGCLQANLVILPAAQATDFERFCRANPKPCPLLSISKEGQPHFPTLGPEIDLRTDLPGYRIWRNGALDVEVPNISEYWRPDLVAFALGCSFGFEAALIEAGFDLPHYREGRNVAMYNSTIPLTPSGAFAGNMVVSMRYIPADRLDEAVAISKRFPQCHGAPIHVGNPQDIGITSLDTPDYGDPPRGTGTPVFWACGVTPQAALQNAQLPFAITHAPGKMLICDIAADAVQALNPAD